VTDDRPRYGKMCRNRLQWTVFPVSDSGSSGGVWCYSLMLISWRMKSDWRCIRWQAEWVNLFNDRHDQHYVLIRITLALFIILPPSKWTHSLSSCDCQKVVLSFSFCPCCHFSGLEMGWQHRRTFSGCLGNITPPLSWNEIIHYCSSDIRYAQC